MNGSMKRTPLVAISMLLLSAVQAGPTPTPCTVGSPACRGIFFVPPTVFPFLVSEPVDPATLDASDLTVNGRPADSVTLSNGNMEIDFFFNTSPAVEGVNTVHISDGAFNCVFSGPVLGLTCTFLYERIPRPDRTPRPRPTPPPRPAPSL